MFASQRGTKADKDIESATDDDSISSYDDVSIASHDDTDNTEATSIETRTTTSCCSRLRHEFHQGMFSLTEPNGSRIDIQRTFAPNPFQPMMAAKAVFFVWSLSAIIVANRIEVHNTFSLSYLTHWSLIATLIYQIFSMLVLIKASQPESAIARINEDGNAPHHSLIKWMWVFFSMAATLEVIIGIFFWPLLILWTDSDASYSNVMMHGGVATLLLIDGLWLNRIPLRFPQVVFPMLMGVLYTIWSIVHWKLDLGNPLEDYDELYPNLNWETDPLFALFQCLLVIFLVIPGIFMGVRSLSLWSGWLRFDGNWRRKATLPNETKENHQPSSNIIVDV